jgi:hypothetical protein
MFYISILKKWTYISVEFTSVFACRKIEEQEVYPELDMELVEVAVMIFPTHVMASKIVTSFSCGLQQMLSSTCLCYIILQTAVS